MQAVRRRDTVLRLLPGEAGFRFAKDRNLRVRARFHGDLLARHEEDLPDWQVVRTGDAFPGLQHVTELGIVDVPIGLDAHDQHRRDWTLDVVEYRRVDGVPAFRGPEAHVAAQ